MMREEALLAMLVLVDINGRKPLKRNVAKDSAIAASVRPR